MAETTYPHRVRCKTCRKALGAHPTDPVYRGLFCSPKCAGMPTPHVDPSKAPRECVTQRDGSWAFKRKYRAESEIPDRLREDPSTSWYVCSHCGHLHIGHTRMGEAEQFRMLRSVENISDVLTKRRGKATVRQVAQAAGVRPIRLKELEEGTPHAENLVTLFKVALVLGMDMGFSFKQR